MPFGELDALYMHIFTAVEDIETVLLFICSPKCVFTP